MDNVIPRGIRRPTTGSIYYTRQMMRLRTFVEWK